MWNENLGALSILQLLIENRNTYICEDENICILADISSFKFLFGMIYFSETAIGTLNCTGNPFDDKLILLYKL